MSRSPLYVTFEEVRLRLIGKVRFTDTPETDGDNIMSVQLARVLIAEGEGQVEMDLSPRYFAPFTSITTGDFNGLVERPTKNLIKMLCEIKAVIRILKTDFGSGTAVDASKYVDTIEKDYMRIIDEDVMAKFDTKTGSGYNATKQWKYPPMPDLKKAYHNTEADDGYAGLSPLVTSHMHNQFATEQINDPSETFWSGFGGRGDRR